MQTLDFTILETIFIGHKHSVYRAESKTKTRVILKVFTIDHPSESEILRFQNEFKILEKLKHARGIAEVIDFGIYKGKYALVFKNSNGKSLGADPKKYPLYTFFKIAKSTVTALEKIHNQRIIHTDLKPSNILFDSETGNIEIID